MTISVETYKRVAVEDPSGHWELVCGRLRQKPDMTIEHNDSIRALGYRLISQLDHCQFAVDMGQTKVHVAPDTYCIPDLAVIPREAIRRKRAVEGGELEVYTEPLPLIAEALSRSTRAGTTSSRSCASANAGATRRSGVCTRTNARSPSGGDSRMAATRKRSTVRG